MLHFPKRRRKDSDLISATEIACFAFCPEQWRLQHGLGLRPDNQAELSSGNRHHRRQDAAERLAGGFLALGRLLAVIGLLGLLWLVWRFR